MTGDDAPRTRKRRERQTSCKKLAGVRYVREMAELQALILTELCNKRNEFVPNIVEVDALCSGDFTFQVEASIDSSEHFIEAEEECTSGAAQRNKTMTTVEVLSHPRDSQEGDDRASWKKFYLAIAKVIMRSISDIDGYGYTMRRSSSTPSNEVRVLYICRDSDKNRDRSAAKRPKGRVLKKKDESTSNGRSDIQVTSSTCKSLNHDA